MNEQTLTTGNAIIEYSETEAALSGLRDRYQDNTYEVETTEGMAEAVRARNDIRQYRTGLEKLRKELKEPALRRCQMIDGEAKRISGELTSLEKPIQEQIDEAAKRAARQEQERLASEIARIASEERVKKEAEAKEIAGKQAQLDKERAEYEEQKRKDREETEAKEAIARAAREAEENRQSEARRKIEDDSRAVREAEEKVRREQLRKEDETRRAKEAKLADERRAIEEAERKVREEKQAVEREQLRIKQEALDADAALVNFKTRFGHLPKYKGVVEAINNLELESSESVKIETGIE